MNNHLTTFEEILRKAFSHEKGKPKIHDLFLHPDEYKTIWGSEVHLKPNVDIVKDIFISQGIKEFGELLNSIRNLKKRDIGLEIGFFKGGTHIIFREFFKKFISVESDPRWFAIYLQNTILDERSEFVIGSSSHPKTLDRVKELTGGDIDFIFIDGGHQYHEVKNDFLNYWPMLSLGGLLAIHDTNPSLGFPGIYAFIDELKRYHFEFHNIHIDYGGISYIIKDEKNSVLKLPENKFIYSLENIKIGSKICLYGAGEKGSLWEKVIEKERKDINLIYYIDTYKNGYKDGLPIVNLQEITKKQDEFDCIIVTSIYYKEIEKTLKEALIDNFFIIP